MICIFAALSGLIEVSDPSCQMFYIYKQRYCNQIKTEMVEKNKAG